MTTDRVIVSVDSEQVAIVSKMGNVVDMLPVVLSLVKVAVAVIFIEYDPASEKSVLSALKSNLVCESTKVSQVGKAEPSDLVAVCESVNEDDCEFGEIVKYTYENERGEPKIAYVKPDKDGGATS